MFSVRRAAMKRYSLSILVFATALILLWPNLLTGLFSYERYAPHAFCYLWEPGLLWLHGVSDVLIGTSYVAISFTLAYLVYRARRDIPFHWVFLAFGAFIIACGSTHFIEVWTLWMPVYWFSGAVKVFTAVASIATAVVLPPLVPRTLALVEAARLSGERKLKLETANRELEGLYTKSVELDQLKTAFFDNVSHELRTPLALILGPVQKLLDDDQLSSAERRDLEVVERNARTLLARVNDLLDLSKLDAGKMELATATVDLAALVRLSSGHFETLAEGRNITLVVDTPAALPMTLDGEKMQRVLLNLLSNAFKFTPDGGTVRCAVERRADRVELTVQDTGPGVPSELRDAIFERFRQGDGSATRRFGGTGLGLAIAREIIALHGGTIAVADAPGGGASFQVSLPFAGPDTGAEVLPVENALAPASIGSPAAHAAQPGAGEVAVVSTVEGVEQPLVLIVEDHPEMSRFIDDILAPQYRTATAGDGEEGLRQALELRPDLILSDVMMPRMSGDQLVRALRAHAELAAVPIVLLTARAHDALRVELLRAGAQDYLVKPFAPEELRARVDGLIRTKLARDILQRRLASQQEDIAVLANEAQDAIRLRDEFLTIASHELKTPITGMLANAQLLQRRMTAANTSERDQRAVRVILEQVQRLNALVTRLLDISRIQNGQLPLELKPLDLCALVARVTREIEPALDRHTVAVSFDTASLGVSGDAMQLEQVVQNLLQNAIKYSPDGGAITVRVEQHQGEACISVRDEGVGIPAADKDRIFQRFYRAGNINPMQISGFGIGLYIVHQIVSGHGGRVTLESMEGQGSTFTVCLPVLTPGA